MRRAVLLLLALLSAGCAGRLPMPEDTAPPISAASAPDQAQGQPQGQAPAGATAPPEGGAPGLPAAPEALAAAADELVGPPVELKPVEWRMPSDEELLRTGPPAPTPEERFARIGLLYGQGNFAEALSMLRELKRVSPDYPGSLLVEARTLHALHRPEEGLLALETLMGRREGGPETVRAYVAWAGRTGAAARARKTLAEVVGPYPEDVTEESLDSYDAELWGALGWLAFEAGDLAEARRRLEAVNRTPTVGPFGLLLARTRFLLGDHANAAELARRVREAGLDADGDALLLLADVDRLEGRAASAEKGYEELLVRRPGHYAATVNLGLLRLGQGDAKAAAALFGGASRTRPELPEAWNGLGLSLRVTGDFAGAGAAFGKALAADANFLPALKNQGILLEKYLGQPAEALAFYEKYLILKGADEEVDRWVKAAKRQLGRE